MKLSRRSFLATGLTSILPWNLKEKKIRRQRFLPALQELKKYIGKHYTNYLIK